MNKGKLGNLVIGIYFHPEAYPPTLNAVSALSEIFEQVSIVHRPHLSGSWAYPANVQTIAPGRAISSSDQEKASLPAKIVFYLQFLVGFFKICVKSKPSVILVYDTMSLFAYYLLRPFLFFNHKIWYHNHDVSEESLLRKYSIGWFALRAEKKAFKHLDIFSLPSNDRLQYFPMDGFKGKYFYLPNFPSIRFYSGFYKERILVEPIRLIFQGSIGAFHGIEEIIPLLKNPVNGYRLELVLKGPCQAEYRESCEKLAEVNGVAEKISFYGVTPYREVPEISSQCHIGIGILARQDLMNKTLGTASNKIYEYAAVGLPVIYYDSPDFTRYLGKFQWAVPTALSSAAIHEALVKVIVHYDSLSKQARTDFLSTLNYEDKMSDVTEYLQSLA